MRLDFLNCHSFVGSDSWLYKFLFNCQFVSPLVKVYQVSSFPQTTASECWLEELRLCAQLSNIYDIQEAFGDKILPRVVRSLLKGSKCAKVTNVICTVLLHTHTRARARTWELKGAGKKGNKQSPPPLLLLLLLPLLFSSFSPFSQSFAVIAFLANMAGAIVPICLNKTSSENWIHSSNN